LLPFVYSSTASFLNEFGVVPKGLQTYFCAGAITFIAVYLFVLEPSMVYNAGHKILEVLFQFFTPLVKVAPFLLPIYTIVIFVLYKFAALFIRSDWLLQYAMFLFGFTLALHLVFSSKSMRSRKGDLLKGNYIFGFSFIYIVNLGIMAFCLNLIFKDFSFVDFCNSSYATARDLYHSVFSQLFLK
ncbi:MAG: hypothetical protein KJ818_04555, partial [Candidatus Omnitrophica bacterium]|nr:hypothetical protein [Candidatus Omnitrophota bacterium]